MLRNALPKIVTPLPGPKAKEIIERRAKAMPDAIRCIYPCVIKRAKAPCLKMWMGTLF